jgi:hypothetical protein
MALTRDELLTAVFPDRVEEIGLEDLRKQYVLEGVVEHTTQPVGTYYFLSSYHIPPGKIEYERSSLWLIYQGEKTKRFQHILLPLDRDILTIMAEIGRILDRSSEIDKIMRRMGYDV